MRKILLASLFLNLPLWAQNGKTEVPQWEIAARTTLTGIFFSTKSGNGDEDTSLKAFALGGGANYTVLPWLQAGIDLFAAHASLNGRVNFTSTVLYAVGGPTFNLLLGDDDLTNAFYFSPKAGVLVITGGGSATGVEAVNQVPLAFTFTVGKRFPITRSITFNPHVTGAVTTHDAMKNPAILVFPLAFSLHL